jgi:hypothetical protein
MEIFVNTKINLKITITGLGIRYPGTVKAPNFDRAFVKNLYFLRIVIRSPQLKKVDFLSKIRS